MIAKLIVRGKDRGEAVSRMARALEMFIIEGIFTTIPLHRRILADPTSGRAKSIPHSSKDFWRREASTEKCACGAGALARRL